MSTTDFLFQNQAPSVWTSPSWSNTQSPEWWQAAAQGLITRASQVAGQGYQPYQGPRIAGFDPLQGQAIQNAGAYRPQVNDLFGQATSSIGQAGNPFNRELIDSYMSPYTDNVINRIGDLGARNLSEKLLPEVNDTFIRAGQFGSSRNADFTLRALRDTQESVLGQQALALESAQNQAVGNAQTAANRQLESGRTLGALGQYVGDENRAQLESMYGLGQKVQDQNQANLNLAAKDFENQVNYPQKNLEMLNSIIRGYAGNLGQTTTSYSAQPTYGSTSPLTNAANILQSASGGSQQTR